jgi:transposase
MLHHTGTDREQLTLFPLSLDEMVDQDNPVRIIDLFVNRFDFVKLGFNHSVTAEEGRPPYLPADLMKLYLYGYLNRIRSSRKLEKECTRNIELIWLMKGLHPSFRTIAGFRSEHPRQIKNFFREFVALLQGWDLVEGKLIAIDGSKFRAVNAKKNNFNEKKIDAQLTYIDQKINQYIHDMDAHDQDEHGDQKIDTKKIKSQIEKQQQRRKKYEALKDELKKSGQEQISTTDPDARSMPVNHGRIDVSYNAQTAVDAKNSLIVHYKNLNTNDRKALVGVATEAKKVLQKKSIEVLADKGYHNGEQIHTCTKNNIVTYVAVPDTPRPRLSDVPAPEYYGENFIYDEVNDCFTCPQKQTLTTNGKWYLNHYDTPVKHYKTSACQTCPAKSICTANARGRLMIRSKYAKTTELNKLRIENEKEKYLLRQQIVEHPFGTIKRQWGFDHVLLKGLKKNEADFGLIFSAYNLRRILSLLGIPELKKRLENAFLFFFASIRFTNNNGINYFFRCYNIL